jgi:hypothetical protein
MRRKQFDTLDHPLLLIVVEPILTRLKAGNYWVPCRCRMLGCMLTRRTVAASDVPTLGTPTEMKPPTFRRRQAFHTPIAARLRSWVDPARTLFHLQFSFRSLGLQNSVKPPAKSSRQRLFLPLLEPRLHHGVEVSQQSGLPACHLAPLRP